MHPIVTIIILAPILAVAWFVTGRFKWFVIGFLFALVLHWFFFWYVFCVGLLIVFALAIRDEQLRERIVTRALEYEPETPIQQLAYARDHDGQMQQLASRLKDTL
jgi:hypothetical protein